MNKDYVLGLEAIIIIVLLLLAISLFHVRLPLPAGALPAQTTNITYLAISAAQVTDASSYNYSLVQIQPTSGPSGFINANNSVAGFASLYTANQAAMPAGLPLEIQQVTIAYKDAQSADSSLSSFVNSTQLFAGVLGQNATLTQLDTQNVGGRTYAYELSRPSNNTAVFLVAFSKNGFLTLVEESCILPSGSGCGLESTYAYAKHVAGQIR